MLMHTLKKFFSPFIWWISVSPNKPSPASIKMPMPAPK